MAVEKIIYTYNIDKVITEVELKGSAPQLSKFSVKCTHPVYIHSRRNHRKVYQISYAKLHDVILIIWHG